MTKPHFTITLGQSDQRVVKGSRGDYKDRSFNGPVPSGSKRSLGESFARSADKSLKHNSKRMRPDESAMGYGKNRQTDDSHIGPNDLRVKLMEKSMSRRAQFEIAERKKKELYEKVSRAIRSAESQEESRSRYTTLSRRVDEPRQMDAMRSSYASPTLNGVRTRSPDRVIRYSGEISNHRSAIDELQQVSPMRQLDAPRTGRYSGEISAHRSVIDELPRLSSMRQSDAPRTGRSYIIDPVDSTRISVPLPTTSRAPLNSSNLVRQLPPVTGGMSRPPYPENQSQPVTVSSLLNTLGLGKYSINFQAEEIDMLALKQMGEHDLKDLGIPMGPRKKILVAVEAHTKRLIAQARNNYMQSRSFAK